MTEIIMTVACDYCHGDGYLTVTLDQWNSYQAWIADPTEGKINSRDNFPQFLKMLYIQIGMHINGNIVTIPCVRCGGSKTIQKVLTLDDLRNLLQ
jgi:hypothetical protein